MRQKIPELEVLGELGILILRCDFDEAVRRIIAYPRLSLPRRRPVTDVVKPQSRSRLLGCGTKSDYAEVGERFDGVADLEGDVPYAWSLRSSKASS